VLHEDDSRAPESRRFQSVIGTAILHTLQSRCSWPLSLGLVKQGEVLRYDVNNDPEETIQLLVILLLPGIPRRYGGCNMVNSKGLSSWRQFEEFARKIMTRHFGVKLTEENPRGFPKKFDVVSSDEKIVGDAKFLTLVHGKNLPPAKFMEIAGHVWLLEKVKTKRRFLVFGNQKRVPEWWLVKYGDLVQNVEFYFIDDKGDVERLR